ncbi:hypothetical protein GMRT_15236 [Giardia muris]|uniref:Uncharacterized protein n=1 Tax=Giardia muris TaxID=5742 RepID=A0A4Z1SR25_GIAMU|nr:hypothetical protein GMRT_15236 [Giardia muris]|eukprot:TNJ28160.1 hypothetical protein GMRT_15236 [Giardia muris]
MPSNSSHNAEIRARVRQTHHDLLSVLRDDVPSRARLKLLLYLAQQRLKVFNLMYEAGAYLAYLPRYERGENSLASLFLPSSNNELYSRIYNGPDYAGDLFDAVVNRKDYSGLYASYQNLPYVVPPGRIAPRPGHSLLINIKSLPLDLRLNIFGNDIRASRPLLRLAVCSLTPRGAIQVHGNVLSLPLEETKNGTLNLQDTPDFTNDLFRYTGSGAFLVKTDLIAHRRSFILVEFTALLRHRRSSALKDIAVEAVLGVSCLGLSPVEDYDSSFRGALTAYLNGKKEKRYLRKNISKLRAREDRDRIDSLMTVLMATSVFDPMASGAREVINMDDAVNGPRRRAFIFKTGGFMIPVFSSAISEPLDRLIGKKGHWEPEQTPRGGRAADSYISIEIRAAPNELSGSIARLPASLIIHSRLVVCCDHIAAAFASLQILASPARYTPPCYGKQGTPGQNLGDIDPKTIFTDWRSLSAILYSFGRYEYAYFSSAPTAITTGSSALFLLSGMLQEHIKAIPDKHKSVIGKTILPPVALKYSDDTYLVTFIICLRIFSNTILPRLRAVTAVPGGTCWEDEEMVLKDDKKSGNTHNSRANKGRSYN